MSYAAALPDHLSYVQIGSILTFIVPAPRGCNLNCPFCYIDRRKEAARSLDLSPSDYVAFIEQMAMREKVSAICLQGYEPLLPESFEYTQAILEAGKRLRIVTSLVTNGTHLSHWIDDLAELELDKLTVSIDSADPAIHDKTRGKLGAFEDAMAGLRLAAANAKLAPVLTLASVLMPERHQRLLGMPELASSLDIRHWVVTVLNQVGKDDVGGPVGDRRKIFGDLVVLKREAERQGINFVVDDEFGTLDENDIDMEVVDINALRIRRLENPSGTFRLLPTGQCSMGLDILKEVGAHTPTWSPDEDAYAFVERMRQKKPSLAAVS